MSAAKPARLRHAEGSRAQEAHRRKQNRRAAAPICRTNLHDQIESLHLKQKGQGKKTRKGRQLGLTESRSELKRIHLLLTTGPESDDNEPKVLFSFAVVR